MDCTHKEQYVARSIFSSWKSLYKMYVLHRNIHNFTNCCEFSSLGNHSLKMPCLWKIWFVGFFNNWSINSKFLPFVRLQCHKEKRDIESGDVLHVFLCTVFFFSSQKMNWEGLRSYLSLHYDTLNVDHTGLKLNGWGLPSPKCIYFFMVIIFIFLLAKVFWLLEGRWWRILF